MHRTHLAGTSRLFLRQPGLVLVLVGLLGSVLGCAGSQGRRAGAPSQAAGALSVSEISSGAQSFLEKQEQGLWLAWTEGRPLAFEALLEEAEPLFRAQSIRTVGAALANARAPAERKGLSHLRAFLVGEHLSRATREHTQEIDQLESGLTFSDGKRTYAYRALPLLLANEPNRSRRKALFDAAMAKAEELTRAYEKRRQRMEAVLRELGYASTLAYVAELRQRDLAALEALAEETLSKSQGAYESALERLAQSELNLSRKALTLADLPRLFRPDFIDDAFPREHQLTRITRVANLLGVELDAVPGLMLDTESRPGKQGRALCLAPKVPEDVRLSLNPGGGFAGELSAMQELGHCLFFSHVEGVPFELAKLGPSTAAQTYGLLLRGLLSDERWLEDERKITGKRLGRHLERVATYRLFELRRDAAMLLYALEAARAPAEARALHGKWMTRALGVTVDDAASAAFERELDPLLTVSPGFEATILSGQLRGALQKRFGAAWWTRREAGAFLRELWTRGNTQSVPELAQAYGASRVDPEPVLAWWLAKLGAPNPGF